MASPTTSNKPKAHRQENQVIIVGSLILGFWLVGSSIYLIVS